MMLSQSNGATTSASASVQVVVRLRPLNWKEQTHGTLPVVSANTLHKTVTLLKGAGSRQSKTSYQFDNVFTAFSTQNDVFDETLKPMLKDVLMGYESTVFAYGQTGTGKTHTMEGSLDKEDDWGVIPRSASAIFSELQQNPEFVSHSVQCSFLEIYNEELRDLLAASKGKSSQHNSNLITSTASVKLAIMEGKNGPFCRGLSQVPLLNAEELLGLMRKAQEQRQVGETNMNQQSSRSHCIFTLEVQAKRKLADGSVLDICGKLHCVDLAGSECAKSADVEGGGGEHQVARERERMNINRSLLTLGRVVSILKDISENPKKKSTVRIPYRDSKLTRILQESLGGRCKTCLIATISPSVTAIDESMSTLNYAQAANGIINKPVTTSSMTVGTSLALGIDKTSPTEECGAGSVQHWYDMEVRLEYMKSQVEEAQQALARKHIQHQEIVERAEHAEYARQAAERKYDEATNQVQTLELKLETTAQELEQTKECLYATSKILQATQKTEERLTGEATSLLNALIDTIADGESMHSELLLKRQAQVDCRDGTKEYRRGALHLLNAISNELTTIREMENSHHAGLLEKNTNHHAKFLSSFDAHQKAIEDFQSVSVDKSNQLRATIHESLIPSFQSLSASLKEDLSVVNGLTKQSQDMLQARCSGLAAPLKTAPIFLAESQSLLLTSSEDLNRNINDCLLSSTIKLAAIALHLRQSLDVAAKGRKERREVIAKLMNEWKDSCHQSVVEQEAWGIGHNEKLLSATLPLQNEGDRRQKFLKGLSDEGKKLTEIRASWFHNLEKQHETLQQQYNMLLSSHEDLVKRNEVVQKNVITGVQQLLQKEFSQLSKVQQASYDRLQSNNNTLQCANGELSVSLDSTFQVLQSSHSKLVGDVEKILEKQDSACKGIKSESGRFGAYLRDIVRLNQQSTDRYVAEVGKAMADCDSDDKVTSTNLDTMICAKLDGFSSDITSSVQGKMMAGVSSLNLSTEAIFRRINEEFIQDVLTGLVEGIQQRQYQFQTTIQDSLAKLISDITSGEELMEIKTKKNLEVAKDLQQTVVEAHEYFSKTVDDYKQTLQRSSWLEKDTKEHSSKLHQRIASVCSHVDQSTKKLDAFATDVMQCEVTPVEVQSRFVPEFIDNFSSTPSPEFILKGDVDKKFFEQDQRCHTSAHACLQFRALKDRTLNTSSGREISLPASSKRPADNTRPVPQFGKRAKS